MMPLKDPSASQLSPESISALTDLFCTQVDFKQGDSLAHLISKLGGKIFLVDPIQMLSPSVPWVTANAERDFEIRAYIHRRTEDKIDLATALGHYVLHYLYPHKIGQVATPFSMHRYANRSRSLCRREAEWFAACLLMPEKTFSADYLQAQKNNDFSRLIWIDYDLPSGVIHARAKGSGLR